VVDRGSATTKGRAGITHWLVSVLILLAVLALATAMARGVMPPETQPADDEVQTFTTDPPPVEFNGRLVARSTARPTTAVAIPGN